jgi:hypothetical protein
MTRLDGLVRRARNRAEEDTNFSLLFESALCNLLDRPDSVSVEALALRKLSEAFDRFVESARLSAALLQARVHEETAFLNLAPCLREAGLPRLSYESR